MPTLLPLYLSSYTAITINYFSSFDDPLHNIVHHLPIELIAHQTIALHLPTYGGLLSWKFPDPKQPNKIVKVQPVLIAQQFFIQ
ncbi:hypothetical protein [Gallibacterium salpingitidis]|uniref:hypothetical protein n=1 Tax=Gallibacterium salpingitidis TaxID=505341 RepID=UPI0012E8D232|nr:hypothetical protein [Gallibacterium salpingitidis]